jgi:hypothetical protein
LFAVSSNRQPVFVHDTSPQNWNVQRREKWSERATSSLAYDDWRVLPLSFH